MEPSYLPMVDDDVDLKYLFSGSCVKVVQLTAACCLMLEGDNDAVQVLLHDTVSTFGCSCLNIFS